MFDYVDSMIADAKSNYVGIDAERIASIEEEAEAIVNEAEMYYDEVIAERYLAENNEELQMIASDEYAELQDAMLQSAMSKYYEHELEY